MVSAFALTLPMAWTGSNYGSKTPELFASQINRLSPHLKNSLFLDQSGEARTARMRSLKEIPSGVINAIILAALDPADTASADDMFAAIENRSRLSGVHPIRIQQQNRRQKIGQMLNQLMQNAAGPWRIRHEHIGVSTTTPSLV